MKFVLKCLAVLVIALFLGIFSALLMVNSSPEETWIKNGPWLINLAIGSKQAGMYTRAFVARFGLFALQKSEAIYYSAHTDDEGQLLRSSCDYRIEGRDIDARWWSITAYGSDQYLIPNEQNRWSFNGKNVKREADGRYVITLSSNPKGKNWLPSGNFDQVYLTLRLYNPAQAIYENPGAIALPRIAKGECR
jgi:hypothetical protein